jgi:23S rRNA pseudouridine1911/1915/1917 synthase
VDLKTLYEDTDVVAVLKPAGMLTHGDGRSQEKTAEDWFSERYGVQDAGYVHRLDRDTSGVLLFAKNLAAYEFMRRAFHDHAVKKTYLAIVYGVPKDKNGVIDFDIGRSRKDFRLRSAQPKAKGRLREALTRYHVVGEYKDCALLEVTPKTGRTHQIRVHLKAIHHPVVGDALYARNRSSVLSVSRLALHAYTLEFSLPSGKDVHIVAPVPPDLASAFAYFPGAIEKFALE